MSTILLPTTALDSRFPLSLNSLYNYRCTGRVDWLVRRRQFLWINVRKFNQWAAQEGKAFRLDESHPMAIELAEGERGTR
jgi:hypothetical protein